MPLGISRLAKAGAAICLGCAPLVALSVPALADSREPAPKYEWWLKTLHVVNAWQSGDASGIKVAILADGVAADQSYLAGSVIQGPDFTHSGRSESSPYYGVLGTSLASLIVGHGAGKYPSSPSRAVDGVAPGAKVLAVRVTLSPGDPLWSNNKITSRLPGAIAAGIRYAVNHGATVIDLPADPGVHDQAIGSGSAAAAGGSTAERAAVSYAVHKNVLLIAPAGDNALSGDGANYPAAYPGVVAVGAFGRTFVKASYSSHQQYVTLTAAGQGVVAASRNGFLTMNTTCAASAIVAGIGALLRSEFPNLTAAQIRSAMTDSTVYRPKGAMLDGSGYGTIDASRSLASAATMSPPHARPAMQGAKPRTRPTAPAVRGSASTVMHQISGDAAVSGAVLAVFLIPILLYGLAIRRRDQRETAAAAERSQLAGARSGQDGMLADPLLEFFAPQHARPVDPATAARSPMAPRFQPRPGLTGRSTMSAPLMARPGGPGGPAGASARVAGAASASGFTPRPTGAHAAGADALRIDAGTEPGAGAGLGTVGLGTVGGGTVGGGTVAGGRAAGGRAAGGGGGVAGGGGVDADGADNSLTRPPRILGGIGTNPIVRQAQVSGSPPWKPGQRTDLRSPLGRRTAARAKPGDRRHPGVNGDPAAA